MLSHVRLRNSKRSGFKPQYLGTGATVVPAEAVIVDDTASSISYNPPFIHETLMSHPNDSSSIFFYNHTQSWNSPATSEIVLKFRGSGVWWFAKFARESVTTAVELRMIRGLEWDRPPHLQGVVASVPTLHNSAHPVPKLAACAMTLPDLDRRLSLWIEIWSR